MVPQHINGFGVNEVAYPLVTASSEEYPNGFGLQISFDDGRTLRRALRADLAPFSDLAREHGAVLCTVGDTAFRARGVFAEQQLPTHQPKPFPRLSLPFHVDLERSAPTVSHRVLGSFFWRSGSYFFWQNAKDHGRYASTVFTPPSVVAKALDSLPDALAGDWEMIREAVFRNLDLNALSPTQQVMLFRDVFISILDWTRDDSRRVILSTLNAINRHVLDATRSSSLVVDWSAPMASRGLVCVVDGGARDTMHRPLVHARDNRGRELGRPTVYQGVRSAY